MTTEEVLAHQLRCFVEGDLDGILSDYSSDAVLFTADGPLKGRAAIGRFFDYELATDTLAVRDGRIVAHSFTARITSKG